jgi:hypothetical protein
MSKISARAVLLAFAIIAAALAIGGAAARAAGGATLSLQVFPSALLSGGHAAILATFTNTSGSTFEPVIVSVRLAGGTFDAGGSSAFCRASDAGAACSLGEVAPGGVVTMTIAFTAPSGDTGDTVTFDGAAIWKIKDTSHSRQSTTTSASATLISTGDLAAFDSSCLPGGGMLAASAGGRTIAVTAGANTVGLTCTPIITGIDNSSTFFTKLPPLATPATVVLQFTGSLPVTYALHEFPNYPDTSTVVIVPDCNSDGSIPSPAAPGYAGDACIWEFHHEDGRFVLHVQGSATGDPGWPGAG